MRSCCMQGHAQLTQHDLGCCAAVAATGARSPARNTCAQGTPTSSFCRTGFLGPSAAMPWPPGTKIAAYGFLQRLAGLGVGLHRLSICMLQPTTCSQDVNSISHDAC